MMRKFLEDECLAASSHASSPIFTKYFKDILPNKDEQLSGALQQIFNDNVSNRDFFTSVNPRDVIWNDDPGIFNPHPPMRTMVMDDGNYEDLKQMYHILLDKEDTVQDIFVPKTYLQTSTMEFNGEIHDSRSSPSPRANHIMASWFMDGSIVQEVNEFRPAVIEFFMKHCIEVTHTNGDTNFHTLVLACVSWFKPHEKKNCLHPPLQVWCKSLFEEDCPAMFLPVGRIRCRFCPIPGEVNLVGSQKENVLIVNPLQQKWAAE